MNKQITFLREGGVLEGTDGWFPLMVTFHLFGWLERGFSWRPSNLHQARSVSRVAFKFATCPHLWRGYNTPQPPKILSSISLLRYELALR